MLIAVSCCGELDEQRDVHLCGHCPFLVFCGFMLSVSLVPGTFLEMEFQQLADKAPVLMDLHSTSETATNAKIMSTANSRDWRVLREAGNHKGRLSYKENQRGCLHINRIIRIYFCVTFYRLSAFKNISLSPHINLMRSELWSSIF